MHVLPPSTFIPHEFKKRGKARKHTAKFRTRKTFFNYLVAIEQ